MSCTAGHRGPQPVRIGAGEDMVTMGFTVGVEGTWLSIHLLSDVKNKPAVHSEEVKLAHS